MVQARLRSTYILVRGGRTEDSTSFDSFFWHFGRQVLYVHIKNNLLVARGEGGKTLNALTCPSEGLAEEVVVAMHFFERPSWQGFLPTVRNKYSMYVVEHLFSTPSSSSLYLFASHVTVRDRKHSRCRTARHSGSTINNERVSSRLTARITQMTIIIITSSTYDHPNTPGPV